MSALLLLALPTGELDGRGVGQWEGGDTPHWLAGLSALATIQESLATVHQLKGSVGEISRLLARTAEALKGSRQQLLGEARASPVAHMDEGGWREDGQGGYLWCLVSQQPQPVRYYAYDG